MAELPNLRFFFKGLPEDGRFTAHTVEESLEQARGSLYQAWFEALQLSPFYAAGIDSGHWRSEEARQTFGRFGDLRGQSFGRWWKTKGYRLFAEEVGYHPLKLADPQAAEDMNLHGIVTGEALTVRVPLNLAPKLLKQQFDELLQTHHPQYERFDRWEHSTAEVRLQNRRLTNDAVNLFLKVYRMSLPADADSEPPRHYEIGERLKLAPKFMPREGDNPAWLIEKRRDMALVVSDYMKNARNLLAHAAEGCFPCVDDHAWVERVPRRRRTD